MQKNVWWKNEQFRKGKMSDIQTNVFLLKDQKYMKVQSLQIKSIICKLSRPMFPNLVDLDISLRFSVAIFLISPIVFAFLKLSIVGLTSW